MNPLDKGLTLTPKQCARFYLAVSDILQGCDAGWEDLIELEALLEPFDGFPEQGN